MMRDRGHGPAYFRDPAAGAGHDPSQYQDVSQITAVQVTPRPKPRAFPRTNPSYVSVHRRDGNLPAFRHVDTMAASAFNHGYQMRGPAGPERAGSGRYYPSPSGVQTLQTSHSYLGSAESGRRADGVHGDDREGAESDSSMSSSSSDGSADRLRRQYTLDDRRHARPAADQSEAVKSRSGAAGLVGISMAASRHAAGPSSKESKSSDSSPLVDQGPRRRPQRHARQPKSEPEIPPPPRTGAIPNGVLRPSTARRNSEPDYVNIPAKSETQLSNVREGIAAVAGSTQSAVPVEQSHKSGGGIGERINTDETPRSGDGTLRIRDHVSPAADYINCQDIIVTSSTTATSGEQALDGLTRLFTVL